MDTTRDVTYRGFLLNDASIRDNIDPGTGIGKGITGCVIDSWEDSDADVSQFLEKRSLQDGMDAGDVFLGARRIRMAGTLYGKTRALLYDQYLQLRKVLSPVLAQREEPEDKGYRDLTFAIPTNNIDDYPLGAIDLKYKAMPRSKQLVWQRDQQGGDDGDALAIPWQAVFLCKDPTMYVRDRVEIALTGADSGDLTNRGTYIVPLFLLFQVTSAAGLITVAVGDTTFTITIPASTGTRTVRYDGREKTLHLQEGAVNDLRMDLLTFNLEDTHPVIAEGTTPYSFTASGGAVLTGTGNIAYYNEAYA